ncbi:sodium:proton antiporter [Defluviimonas sp. 20V17]|uniref:Iron-sulfur cluster carrier protein n=1 Tax=Allgaiera indica TaxID=765699 RepID=A0AAN4USC8_9RHOB|nr:Mrp/NBP35 family ATP-binding protein [Allgaiera indica]KDB02311.1 sodium:proton antiporter [Defluviimonas sp. 20V17]GHE02764.1 iron-sulfur cluster carrier protein [Allgaiera indica]SDX18069.1 ATP-binding protein involved in chromosome partitioning [Allgaiera indica]
MAVTREAVLEALKALSFPDGSNPVSRDLVRALTVDGANVRFVFEAPSAEAARAMEALRDIAEKQVAQLPGVEKVTVALTAPTAPAGQSAAGAGTGAPPKLRVGGHPTPQEGGPQAVPGVDRILVVASGKGGVGKSTVSANLAVALARQGRRVGLLDADIYGPSQPRMMGVSARPDSPDGETIVPLKAHGVTMMSIGLMVAPETALVWRGPMLMGALQQLLNKVQWGRLDVLIIDLPPGTGDVQLTLGQRTIMTGAIVVSTPQDVALLDARKAIDMFDKLKTPILGLIENMSTYVCPNCGHEEHLFGHGGVAAEAKKMGVPLLAELPLSLDVRIAGDAGAPVATGEGPAADAYMTLAKRLVDEGKA